MKRYSYYHYNTNTNDDRFHKDTVQNLLFADGAFSLSRIVCCFDFFFFPQCPATKRNSVTEMNPGWTDRKLSDALSRKEP